jgi:hypothetical protein
MNALLRRKEHRIIGGVIGMIIYFLMGSCSDFRAQESYGKTLNLGIGLGGYSGYYRYTDRTLPVFHADYEFDVARNFTLAPFLSLHSHNRTYYWGNHNRPYEYYNYREVVVPVGVKGTVYMDSWVDAGSSWDFYLGGSLGFAVVFSRWDSGFDGDRNMYRAPLLFLDIHAGVEYHINPRAGIYLDISSGVSTIGLAIHSKS